MKNPWKMAVCSPAAYQKSPHDIYQHPLGPWHPVGAGWDEKWQLAAAEAAWGDRKKFRDEGCLEVQVIRWNWICKLETSTIEINWIPIIPIKVDVSIYKGWTWGYPSWPHSRSSHCRGLIKVLIRMPGLVESEEMECQIGCGALLAYQCLIINHSFFRKDLHRILCLSSYHATLPRTRDSVRLVNWSWPYSNWNIKSENSLRAYRSVSSRFLNWSGTVSHNEGQGQARAQGWAAGHIKLIAQWVCSKHALGLDSDYRWTQVT